MTPSEKLAALKEMCERATKGPWGFEDPDNNHLVTAGKDGEGAFVYIAGEWGDEITNKFIATSRALLPAAIKVIEEVGEIHVPLSIQSPLEGQLPIIVCRVCGNDYSARTGWPCPTRKIIDAFWEEVKI